MSLIDPSITGMAGNVLSFGTPCFTWKLAAGLKTHWGYLGYDTTISPPNRYLTQTIVYTNVTTFAGQTTTFTQNYSFDIDRISGVKTANPPGSQDIYGLQAPSPLLTATRS